MVKTGCVQEACAICTLHRKVSQQSSSCAGNKSQQTTFTTSKIGRDRRYCARLVPWFLFFLTFIQDLEHCSTQRFALSGAYFLIFLAVTVEGGVICLLGCDHTVRCLSGSRFFACFTSLRHSQAEVLFSVSTFTFIMHISGCDCK